MTVTYEEIAGSRPRVKQDVLFTETPHGVLFHNSQSGFQLTAASAYRLATLLVPYLNGEHSVAELCGALGEGQQRMVVELVGALFDRGFARDSAGGDAVVEECPPDVAREFATQLNYVEHYADRAAERFLRFRGTRVAVLGDDHVAHSCQLSLVRNGAAALGASSVAADVTEEAAGLAARGCPVELVQLPAADGWQALAGFQVVVVSAGTRGGRLLTRLLEEGVPDGVELIPAAQFGDRAVVGPLTRSGGQGCWLCTVLRYSANADPAVAADALARLVVPSLAAAPGPSRPLAAMLGNLLGYEVFRLRTGILPAETDGQVIVQDLLSMDVMSHPMQPHPDCPHCADPTGADATALPGDVAPVAPPAVEPADADDADEIVAQLQALTDAAVNPMVGVFTEFADEEFRQLPLKVGRVRLGSRRTISAFDVHHPAGARLRALHRAAVVHAESVGTLPGLRAARREGDPDVVAPDRLAVASGTGAADVTAWVPGRSVVSGRQCLVPAAAVQPFGAHNELGLCLATGAGSAAAGDPGEALGAGLLSAFGFEALQEALRGRRAVRTVPLGGVDDDPQLRFLARSAANLGVDLELLDLSDVDTGLPVVLARTADPAGGAPVWALGCHLRWQVAAVEAARDVLGQVQLGAQTPGEVYDGGDPLVADLDPYALSADGTAAADLGAAATWDRVLGGPHDAIVVRTTPADLRRVGVHTVRVLLTGRV